MNRLYSKCIALGLALAIGGFFGHGALADEVVINQKDKMFSPDVVSIKAGDSLSFLNGDTVTHAVLITGPVESNLGQIKVGESKSVTFGTAGTYEVRCAIHPKMKLTITVQ